MSDHDRELLDADTVRALGRLSLASLDAVIAGYGAAAEALSRDHILRAANIFVQRLQAQQDASQEELRQRRPRLIQR